MIGQCRSICWVLAALGLVTSTPLWADGTQTGVIAGIVSDNQSTPLQGIEVRLDGPQTQRQALTDTGGRFRFLALGVGSYEVSAELLGLSAKRDDVVVYVDKTTEIELVLSEDAGDEVKVDVEEWIQVVAEAPVIDRFDIGVGANVSFDFLDELPVRRFYQGVVTLLPGVSGGEDGTPNTGGSLRSSNLFLIDGVDTTDPTTGLFGLNLSYEAVQEIQVTTAASPPKYGRASGAIINVVTRSGSNKYKGLARWIVTSNDWNDDYDFSTEQAPHLAPDLTAANSGADSLDSSLALSLGGPLVRDQLWFFTAFENTGSSFLRPVDNSSETWNEDSEVESTAFKLTWQAGPGHTLVAQRTADDASINAFRPFDREPSENRAPSTPSALNNTIIERAPGDIFALEEQSQEGSFTKLQWNAAFGQDLALSVNLAQQDRELRRNAINRRGFTGDAPHVGLFVDPDGFVTRAALFNGVTDQGVEKRPRDQASIAASLFLGSGKLTHELGFGIDYQSTESEASLTIGGVSGVDALTGQRVTGQLFIDADTSFECFAFGECADPFDPVNETFLPQTLWNFWERPLRQTDETSFAVYASDTMSTDRWVVSAGVRYESVRGEANTGRRLVEDDVLAPKASLSYDPLGDGKVLLTASWGRSFEPFLQQYTDAFGRADSFSGFTDYTWDPFLDPACGFEDPSDIDSFCWVADSIAPLIPVLNAPPNLQLQRSSVDELVVGFERQFTDFTSLSLHYVDRSWDNLWDDVFGFDPNTGQSTTVVSNLNEARRQYRAIQALVQKRFSQGWQLFASYTYSEAEGNLFADDGRAFFADFLNATDTNLVNRFGPAPYDRPHQLTVFGNYQVPFRRALLSVGSVLQYRDGVPYQRERFDDFGIRFVTPRGSERLSGTLQLDLAATVNFRMAKDFELELKGEIFNLTGGDEQIGAESLEDTGRFGLPRTLEDLQTPRSFRFTLGLRF